MDNGQQTIQLLGKDHPIRLPGFSEREDIAVAYTTEAKRPRRQQRALFGCLGLCVPALGLGGLDTYEEMELDLVKYGGRVYSAAMDTGHQRDQLIGAAVECFNAVCGSLFPREAEVDTAENFTAPTEEART